MRSRKRLEFLESIRLPPEEDGKRAREAQSSPGEKRSWREELDLQKELERRFEELFGSIQAD